MLGGANHFEHFLEPVFENPKALAGSEYAWSMEFGLMLLSVGVALAGFSVAYFWYIRRPDVPERVAAQAGPVYRTVLNKYYVDQIYDALFVNRTKNLGSLLAAFDLGVVDGGVNGVGWSDPDVG